MLKNLNKNTKTSAIALLKRHPELLFKEGSITDDFGRKQKLLHIGFFRCG